MLIKRKVAVKVIVTEKFKQELVARLRQTLQKVEQAQERLERQACGYLSELENKDPAQADAFRRRLERQERRQEEIKARLSKELAGAEKLELETEYLQSTLEGLVEVRVGDNLPEKLHAAEMVLKDGLVVEMRHD